MSQLAKISDFKFEVEQFETNLININLFTQYYELYLHGSIRPDALASFNEHDMETLIRQMLIYSRDDVKRQLYKLISFIESIDLPLQKKFFDIHLNLIRMTPYTKRSSEQ